MHCLRDANAIQIFLRQANSQELISLIEIRVEELSDFDDVPLSELVNIHILDDTSTLDELEHILQFQINKFPIEACIHHSYWTEVVVIVSDDGFGHVIFIPNTINDSSLRTLCEPHIQTHRNLADH